MSREVDRRNFSIDRVTRVREAELDSAALEVSEALPGTHRVRVERFDAVTGNPSLIVSEAAPPEQGNYIQRALAHVQGLSKVLGFAANQAVEYTPDPVQQETSSGAVAVHFQQNYKGIPIFGATEVVSFAPNGRLKKTVGSSVTVDRELSASPQISVQEAVRRAAEHVAVPDDDESAALDPFGQPLNPRSVDISNFEPRPLLASPEQPERTTFFEAGPFGDKIKANLIWFPLENELRLAWEVLLAMPNYDGQYRVLVDAESREILYCHQLIKYAVGKGNVFRVNGGDVRQMTDFPRSRTVYGVLDPGDLPDSFPDDWVDSWNRTQGNNVVATHVTSGQTYQGTRNPDSTVTFNPGNATGDDQQVLNLFYFCNFMHDYFYMLGFRETDGNFQTYNYGRGGGWGGDAVNAVVHPVQIRGIASMGTPSDGSSPRLNVGLVSWSDRHTALDSDIVFHEYTHGVTNRLVGGRFNVHALDDPQSGGMGEGWSDFFPCIINGKTAHGDWVYDNTTGSRHFLYDNNFPDHFGDLGTNKNGIDYTEVHNIGEIWCATLMEICRTIGADLGVRIIFDALKLMPGNPSFLDGRDAILEALNDLHEAGHIGDNEYTEAWKGCWNTFARFGMGPGASSRRASLDGIVADFSVYSVKTLNRRCLHKPYPISIKNDIRPIDSSLKKRLEQVLRTCF